MSQQAPFQTSPLIIGNWKMNGSSKLVHTFIQTLQTFFKETPSPKLSVGLCPPFPFLRVFQEATLWGIKMGGQDCSWQPSGALTGDVSASMLQDVGCSFVLIGHSERRQHHGEDATCLRKKLVCATNAGLQPILCVGETAEQREQGQHIAYVKAQMIEALKDTDLSLAPVIAYEPVWAIGTQAIPSPEAVAEMAACIQTTSQSLLKAQTTPVTILYGGSVKPENVKGFLEVPHIKGALVGGASLDPETFLSLLRACEP